MALKRLLQLAIDILRTNYSLLDSIECISKLLLFKRLSDLASIDQERESIFIPKDARWCSIQKNQTETVDLANIDQEKESIFIPEDARWCSIALEDKQIDIGISLSKAMASIEHRNPILKGLLTNSEDYYWKRYKDNILFSLLRLFSSIDLTGNSLQDLKELGLAYEFLLQEKEKENKGKVYTPPEISQMMVKILNLKDRSFIYDPICGSGELLASAAKYLLMGKYDMKTIGIYGQSRDFRDEIDARLNFIFNGFHAPYIQVGDPIIDPFFIDGDSFQGFDFIVSNPPFSIKIPKNKLKKLNRSELFPYGIPNNGLGDLLFIQHILSSLNSTGKAAILLPHGALSREGKEREIRKNIVEEDVVEAIIELAPNLFAKTDIPVFLLILNKNKAKKREIIFIDASKEYENARKQNFLKTKNVDKIIHTFQKFENLEGLAKIVSLEEVADNDYYLSPSHYVSPPQEEEINTLLEIEKLRLLELEKTTLAKEMDSSLRNLGIEL